MKKTSITKKPSATKKTITKKVSTQKAKAEETSSNNNIKTKKKLSFAQKYLSAEKIADFLRLNVFWLPIWLLFGAVVSGIYKFDFFWDMENYHIYNPWKWLDSGNYDVYSPLGAINSFFNPLPDMPVYILFKYFNDYPTLIHAVNGLWYGGLVFVFHKIALLFFDEKTYRHIICFILTIAIAITGQATLFQAGSTTNEVQIAFFVLWGVYYVLKQLKYPETQSANSFFWGGFLLGVALGLKQTSLPYSFGIGFALIIFYKNLKEPVNYIFQFILGGFLGAFIVFGPFMINNYIEYGNPVIPFLNKFFQSPYYDQLSFQDNRYIPPSFWEFLVHPFVWESRAAEIQFKDWRGKVFYSLVLASALYALVYYILKRKRTAFLDSFINRFTCVYMLIAYLLWSVLFSIFRYLIPMEMFFAIFIVYAMNKFLFRIYRFKALLILQIAIFEILMYGFLSVPTHHNWGSHRLDRQEEFLYMERIKLKPNTLVKLYNLPSGILAPLLARNNPYFKVVSYVDEGFGINIDFVERNKFREIRDRVVQNHKGPVIIFGVGDITAELLRKSNRKHSNQIDGVEDYYYIDESRSRSRFAHFTRVLRRYNAGDHRIAVDMNTVKRFAEAPMSVYKSYKPDNHELYDMYCRPLRTNFRNKRYVVCVPEDDKDTILNPAFNYPVNPEY